MADSLDFKDINNTLYLSGPENSMLARHYAQASMLNLAKDIPELEWHPATSDVIMTCKSGDYDPLDLMEAYEETASSMGYKWAAMIPKDKDFEGLLAESEKLAELHDAIGESGDELVDRLALIGRISRLSKTALKCGVSLRRFYSEMLYGAKILSSETGTDIYSILEEKCHTDELVRLVFPKKETAISEIGAATFFFLPLWKQLKLIGTACEFSDPEWQDFREVLSSMPEEADIDDAMEIHGRYVAREMDRIYS